ncbi:MAG: hypothetical protein PHY02_09690 [Phycisphaerae bacterium]|nr:hypothetical protein [Phycisphaerae bacterium]
MNYPQIRDSLKTFDIINCEAKDIFWRLIGHTAMVYKDPLTGQVMVFESTSLNKWAGISGVQLNPMGLWLANYPGKVFIRQFTFESNFILKSGPEDFIKKYRGTSYPDYSKWDGFWKLVCSALDIRIFYKDIATYQGDDKGIFCTELVVMMLRYCGLMTNGMPADEFEPDNLREGFQGNIKHYLVGCKLGNEIRIK